MADVESTKEIFSSFDFDRMYLGYVLDNSDFESKNYIKIFIPELFGYAFDETISKFVNKENINKNNILNFKELQLNDTIEKHNYLECSPLINKGDIKGNLSKKKYLNNYKPELREKVLVGFFNGNPKIPYYLNFTLINEDDKIDVKEDEEEKPINPTPIEVNGESIKNIILTDKDLYTNENNSIDTSDINNLKIINNIPYNELSDSVIKSDNFLNGLNFQSSNNILIQNISTEEDIINKISKLSFSFRIKNFITREFYEKYFSNPNIKYIEDIIPENFRDKIIIDKFKLGRNNDGNIVKGEYRNHLRRNNSNNLNFYNYNFNIEKDSESNLLILNEEPHSVKVNNEEINNLSSNQIFNPIKKELDNNVKRTTSSSVLERNNIYHNRNNFKNIIIKKPIDSSTEYSQFIKLSDKYLYPLQNEFPSYNIEESSCGIDDNDFIVVFDEKTNKSIIIYLQVESYFYRPIYENNNYEESCYKDYEFQDIGSTRFFKIGSFEDTVIVNNNYITNNIINNESNGNNDPNENNDFIRQMFKVDENGILYLIDADGNYIEYNEENLNNLSSHSHNNQEILDEIDQDIIDNSHTHNNKDVLDTITSSVVSNSHSHNNQEILDEIDQDIIDNSHTHNNKDVLDTITSSVVSNSHTHNNQEILDEIDSETINKINTLDNDIIDKINEIEDVVEDLNELNENSHNHSNKNILDTITSSVVSNSHSHNNKSVLNNLTQSVIDNSHTHANKNILDTITSETINKINTLEENMDMFEENMNNLHTHDNLLVLNRLTYDVINNSHTHENKSALDNITSDTIPNITERIENIEALVNDEETGIGGLSTHTHDNKEALDRLTDNIVTDLINKNHSHTNLNVLNNVTQSVIDNSHTHNNRNVLNNVTQSVIDNSHTHINKDALDSIDSIHITSWNNKVNKAQGIENSGKFLYVDEYGNVGLVSIIDTLTGNIDLSMNFVTEGDFNELEDKVITNTNEITGLKSEVSRISAAVDPNVVPVSETTFNNKVNSIESSITSLNSSVDTINYNIDGINSEISTVKTRVTATENDITNIKTKTNKIDTIESNLNNKANQSTVNNLSNNITNIDNRLQAIESSNITEEEKQRYETAYTHSQRSHAPINAEPNQNAFSYVELYKISTDENNNEVQNLSNTFNAINPTSTFKLVEGDNVNITVNNNKLRIDVPTTSNSLDVANTIKITGGATSNPTTIKNITDAEIEITSLDPTKLSTPVPINKGGTGALTPEGILSNIGINVTAEDINTLYNVEGNIQDQINALKALLESLEGEVSTPRGLKKNTIEIIDELYKLFFNKIEKIENYNLNLNNSNNSRIIYFKQKFLRIINYFTGLIYYKFSKIYTIYNKNYLEIKDFINTVYSNKISLLSGLMPVTKGLVDYFDGDHISNDGVTWANSVGEHTFTFANINNYVKAYDNSVMVGYLSDTENSGMILQSSCSEDSDFFKNKTIYLVCRLIKDQKLGRYFYFFHTRSNADYGPAKNEFALRIHWNYPNTIYTFLDNSSSNSTTDGDGVNAFPKPSDGKYHIYTLRITNNNVVDVFMDGELKSTNDCNLLVSEKFTYFGLGVYVFSNGTFGTDGNFDIPVFYKHFAIAEAIHSNEEIISNHTFLYNKYLRNEIRPYNNNFTRRIEELVNNTQDCMPIMTGMISYFTASNIVFDSTTNKLSWNPSFFEVPKYLYNTNRSNLLNYPSSTIEEFDNDFILKNNYYVALRLDPNVIVNTNNETENIYENLSIYRYKTIYIVCKCDLNLISSTNDLNVFCMRNASSTTKDTNFRLCVDNDSTHTNCYNKFCVKTKDYNDANAICTSLMTADSNYHVFTIVINDNKIYFYIDGELESQNTSDNIIYNPFYWATLHTFSPGYNENNPAPSNPTIGDVAPIHYKHIAIASAVHTLDEITINYRWLYNKYFT